MRIHREGRQSIFLFIISAFLLGIAFQWVSATASYIFLGISLLILIFLLYFFRDPVRSIPLKDEQSIYSPADGKVVVIEETFEPEYLKAKCLQISIFMSPFNVHANRYPVSGQLDYLKYHKGKYLFAWNPKSSTENERTSVAIKNSKGTVFLRQVAGIMARRIVCYAKQGTDVIQGDELGFIKLGSRADLYLPLDTKIKVKLDQKVKAGIDIIAELPA